MADVKWPVFVKPYVRDKAQFTRTKSHPLQGVIQFEVCLDHTTCARFLKVQKSLTLLLSELLYLKRSFFFHQDENEEEDSAVIAEVTQRTSSLLGDPLSAGPLDPLSDSLDPLSLHSSQPTMLPTEQVKSLVLI